MIKSAPVGPVAGGIMGCIMVLVLAVYAYRHQIHRRSHQHMSPLAAQGELITLEREIVGWELKKPNKTRTKTKHTHPPKLSKQKNPNPLSLDWFQCFSPFYFPFANSSKSQVLSRVLCALSLVQPDLLPPKESLPKNLNMLFLSGSWSHTFCRAAMISPASQLSGPCHSMPVAYFCTRAVLWGVLQFSHLFCLGCWGRVFSLTCVSRFWSVWCLWSIHT